jgi:hypothetical protein
MIFRCNNIAAVASIVVFQSVDDYVKFQTRTCVMFCATSSFPQTETV